MNKRGGSMGGRKRKEKKGVKKLTGKEVFGASSGERRRNSWRKASGKKWT